MTEQEYKDHMNRLDELYRRCEERNDYIGMGTIHAQRRDLRTEEIENEKACGPALAIEKPCKPTPKWQYILAAVAIVVTVGIGLWFLQYQVEAFGNWLYGNWLLYASDGQPLPFQSAAGPHLDIPSQLPTRLALVVGLMGLIGTAGVAIIIGAGLYVLVMRIARAIEKRFEPTQGQH